MVRRLALSPGVTASLGLAVLVSGSAMGDPVDLRSSGVVRVLVVDRDGSFQTGTPGTAFGLESDILKAFANLHGLRVEVVNIPTWSDLVPALLEGRGDIVAGAFTVTESRGELVSFTTEVFPARNVVLTRKPHRVVRTVGELREERVGLPGGTSLAETAAGLRLSPSNVDASFEPATVIGALEASAVTACIVDLGEAMLAQKEDPALQLGLFVGSRESYAFAVRKEDAELLKALDRHVTNLRRSASWHFLITKHYGEMAVDVLSKLASPD